MPDTSENLTPGVAESRAREAELERLRALVEYLGEANEQLETVNRIVAAVNTGRSIEEVFELASEQVRALVPFDRASIALCEEGGETLRVFALSGERAGPLSVGARGPLKGSVTELALTERRTVVIPELKNEKRFNAYADLRREGFRSAVCVPLFSMRRAVGARPDDMTRSKKAFSCEVGTLRLRASFARSASGSIRSTRWPVIAEVVTTGAHSRNFILKRRSRSNSEAVFVSFEGSASHLLTATMIEHPASTA